MRSVIILSLIFVSSYAWSQHDSLAALNRHFEEYRNETLQEKLFVHTDRSFYLTGEMIWFKLYYVDASYHQPLDVSKVAYVEVLNKDSKAVLQTKVRLMDGSGTGTLFIPASMVSGHYVLRAYTQWMRNFDPAFYFRQSIEIVNPFLTAGLKPLEPGTANDAQFFPEGGYLVNGLQSKVAFRIGDPTGHGVNARGVVMDGPETVTHFETTRFGLGNFMFRPLRDHHYVAVLTDERGNISKVPMPDARDEGYVMTLADTSENRIAVNIQSSVSSPAAIPYVYLLVHTRFNAATAMMHVLTQGRAVFLIDKTKLLTGVSHLTLFTESLQPVCERLYFSPPGPSLDVTGQASQKQYGVREKVQLDFLARANGLPAETDQSVAVFLADSASASSPDITTWMWLTSELSGEVESPSYYLEHPHEADNLMLTQGWSRFKWPDVFGGKKTWLHYIPEYRGHLIRGRVLSKTTGKPAAGVSTSLSLPGRNIQLYLYRSGEDGRLRYDIPDLFGPHKIVIETLGQEDSTYRIELASPYSPLFAKTAPTTFNLPESMKRSLTERSLNMQLQSIFFEEFTKFQDPGIDSLAFYGKPDESYLLDDYTRFPTMEEVMREYVPGVMVRKRRDGFHFLTIDHVTNTLFRDNPLVLIDGIPVDVNKIMAYDPRKVQKLDVMTQRYFVGHLSFDGVVSYTTYHGDSPDLELDPKAFVSTYEGVQLTREFYSPRYETPAQKSARIPDRRELLFWAPTLKANGEGRSQVEFFTSDVPGRYRVVTQGIDKNGRAGTTSFEFEVKGPDTY